MITLRDVTIGFGGPLVLEGIDLQVELGEHIGLLGRNGTGKTTLLKLLAGLLLPDEGVVFRQQGLRVAYLAQDVPEDLEGTVGEVIAGGLPPVEARTPGASEDVQAEAAWRSRQQVETILSRMQLDPVADFRSLSAGYKRRVLLARGLVSDPDLVLLDEPTNHLDITKSCLKPAAPPPGTGSAAGRRVASARLTCTIRNPPARIRKVMAPNTRPISGCT